MVYNTTKMTDGIHEEKMITSVGARFVEFIVAPLAREVFSAYEKRDFIRSYFQVRP